jgi:hypothetical protein
MRRREFITFLGGAAAWPFAARTQQSERLFRLGILETIPATQNANNLKALRKELRELGYMVFAPYVAGQSRLTDRIATTAAGYIAAVT